MSAMNIFQTNLPAFQHSHWGLPSFPITLRMHLKYNSSHFCACQLNSRPVKIPQRLISFPGSLAQSCVTTIAASCTGLQLLSSIFHCSSTSQLMLRASSLTCSQVDFPLRCKINENASLSSEISPKRKFYEVIKHRNKEEIEKITTWWSQHDNIVNNKRARMIFTEAIFKITFKKRRIYEIRLKL